MRTLVCALMTAAALSGCTVPGAQEPTPGDEPTPVTRETTTASLERVTTKVGGRERTYLRSTPADVDPAEPWPVMLVFHGWQESAEKMRQNSGLEASRAIVVYAEGVDRAWEPAPYATTKDGEDLDFVRTILTEVEEDYAVDPSRVFATGFSNGGGFAAYLSCRMPETFTAVAPVGAAYYRAIHADCTDEPVARLDIHGTYDRTVNYYGGTRHGTTYDPVPDVLDGVARRNGCDGASINRRSTTVVEQHWSGCEMPVSHIRLGGGEHVWPTTATAEVRAFFGV